MQIYDVKNTYNQKGREATLEIYKGLLAERPETGKELAFIAADYAHPEALALLFGAGVSPTIADEYGFTLLHHLAIHWESRYYTKPEGAVRATTEFLLDNKVSVLRKDENEGMTCYHYAAREGMAEMVEALRDRGAKLNMTDREGNTGIHIACRYAKYAKGNIDSKKQQLEQAEKDYDIIVARLKESGMTDEQIAQYMKDRVKPPSEQTQKEYESAVRSMEGYFLVVKAFAEGGVDIDEKNGFGQAALFYAIDADAKKIAAYLAGTLTDSDDAAIAAGGMTLHQAAMKGDADAIKAIAGTGADINGLNDGNNNIAAGFTALAIAVAFTKANAVEALLANGADPSFKDANGRAAAYFFFDTNFRGNPDLDPSKKIIKNIIAAGMNINLTLDDDSDTMLILACKAPYGSNSSSYQSEFIDETLRYNPDVNLTNRFGETALMCVCAGTSDKLENAQTALLERGADVSVADRNGDTALHYAARNRNMTIAKTFCDMLLEFGADPNAVNNDGQNALDIATKNGNEPLVKLLLNKM